MAVANLVNLERVHKAYGIRPLLDDVSLGVGEGERIGVVGRNGDGKTTLLRVLTGDEIGSLLGEQSAASSYSGQVATA